MCDVADLGQHWSSLNESRILQKLNSAYINDFIAFYEDTLMNKTYLVLEHAGQKNIAEFVKETREESGRPLDEPLLKSIMA